MHLHKLYSITKETAPHLFPMLAGRKKIKLEQAIHTLNFKLKKDPKNKELQVELQSLEIELNELKDLL